MGIDPWCCQCIYLILSYHVHDTAYCGGPQDQGDLSHEAGQIWDYEGYLILIIAMDSIYLNPYDNIANRSSEGVSQACTDDSSAYEVQERPNVQRVMFNETWCNGVDLGAIVQEGHASLSIDSYLCYVFDPIPSIKGVWIQEGSLCLIFMSWVSYPGAPLVVSPLFEGLRLPSLVPSPLFGLNVKLF